MWSRVPLLCLLAACGPVVLVGGKASDGGVPTGTADASQVPAAGALSVDAGSAGSVADEDAAARATGPRVVLAVRPVDCRCFDLTASGVDGEEPYEVEWEDGTRDSTRQVCVAAGASEVEVSVTVQDAKARRSAARSTRLQVTPGGCDAPLPASKLCVTNPSFEGTPATNVGVPGAPNTFDVPPWSVCTNPMETNTPDVGDANLSQATGVPPPAHGATFIALAESEQVSQALCAPVTAGTKLALQIDLIDLTATVMATTGPIALEIWGGMASDCSLHELLWTSDPIRAGWDTYCAKLAPAMYLDQITLVAKSDVNNAGISYMGIDHIVPVDDCP